MFNRFCNLRRSAIKALCVVSVAGAVSSCADDYKWDNEDPTWLGSSIYDYLQESGDYKNFIKLIDDLDYAEVLRKTGSKTLFVANDKAFDDFFSQNDWGVKSYSELSLSQKKILLNSAMINNAYLLEMMSSTAATNADPIKGECLRRETAADVTDSIPHFYAEDLPVTYNPTDKDYWKRFRESDKGIYLAIDATSPMMTHFLATQMASKDITDKDFKILTGKERDKADSYIYDCKVIKKDITCQNGYINVLDKVLINPQNMAEVLRTGKNTKIFSHLIDRFSAPFYNSTLTERYRLIQGNSVDSVFQKRYFSLHSQGYAQLQSDANTDPQGNPTGNIVTHYLNFDPGWNQYRSDASLAKEQDMGVIFCPTDECLTDYFFAKDGGGRFLINAYAPEMLKVLNEKSTDTNLIFQAIDQIPLEVIQALINNLMKDSFLNSIPSKFVTIKNSAQDAMFNEDDHYHADRILDVKLANNGVIYIMNEVTTPADYASVSAPAYVETDKRIFNWAIQRGRKNQSETLGGIPTNYYAYLLAMSSRFSFFVPNDENLVYVDPLSFYSPSVSTGSDGTFLVGRAYKYTWDDKKKEPKVASYEYNYDITTGKGEIGALRSSENITEACYGNRLKDMLETHTIIHQDNSESTGTDETQTGAECNKHYFISKNGSVIYIDNAEKRNGGMTTKGGWQIANDEDCTVTGFDDKSEKKNGYGNGFAYMIDKPMIPTIESVFSAMYNNDEFKEFFELCQTDEEILNEIGIKSAAQKARFIIFTNNKGLPCYDKKTGQMVNQATNVRFFNNFNYTVYVPTNEAMQKAYNAGLPTWQDVRDFLELDKDPEERQELTQEQENARNIKAKAMCTAIVNFVRNHFQDNSIFADSPVMNPTQYETATINSETGVYCKVKVSSQGNGTLSVTDATGKTCNITNQKNIIARDYITSGAATPITNKIISSSSAVIHGIDDVLDYKTYEGGRYDSDWQNSAKARAYLNIYELVE